MKKFIYFLILICLCIIYIPKDVKASTFYEDAYIPNIWMNKKNPLDGLIYYNQARFIRETGTNKLAYCIEPFVYLNSNGSYTSSTYHTNYTQSQINQMILAAHFGYGYKNHTAPKWYAITQMYIWKISMPNASYYFSSTKNGPKENMFEEETNELKKLINEYEKNTSLHNKTYYVVNNHKFTQTDTNQTIKDYKLSSTNIEKITINNNLVETETLTTGSYYVNLKRNSILYNHPVLFYQSTSNQDLVKIGDPPEKTNTFKIEVIETEVNIKKIDSKNKNTTPQGDAKLNDSVFTLYNDSNEKIMDIKLNEDSTFKIKNLDFNNYYIVEKTPGTGYKLNTKKYNFTLNKDESIVNIDISNDVITGNLKIYKEYGSNNDFKPEENISFNIYDKNENLIQTITTNSDGIAEIKLPYGKYKLIQLTTTEGYQKIEPIIFEIIEDNQEIIYNFKNYKITVPDTYSTSIFSKIISFIKDILC